MENQLLLEKYKTILTGGTCEIVEKKSHFIANICPVSSEAEALEFIEKIKKQYWDARHNCHAFSVGIQNELTRCSDDGEPSGTAGKPMLNILLGAQLKNTAVVVTRYFGGTLLGTGGLVRAYSRAVTEGLAQCPVIEKKLSCRLKITADYAAGGKIQYIASTMALPVLSSEYTDKVTFHILAGIHEKNSFIKKLAEATSAKAVIEDMGQCYAAEADGQTLIFDN